MNAGAACRRCVTKLLIRKFCDTTTTRGPARAATTSTRLPQRDYLNATISARLPQRELLSEAAPAGRFAVLLGAVLHQLVPRLHLALLRLAQRAGDLLAGCLDQRGDGAAVLHLGQVIVARLQIQHAGFAVGQL